MDEENENTLCQEEALVAITKEILIPKPNNFVNSELNDAENLRTENTSLEIKDNFDGKDCIWGAKQSGNNYKTVTIKNELYALNDCVCCRSGLKLDYIGKIMRLSQENDQKVCTIRWFFRPFELPTSLKDVYKATNSRELFMAFGEGIGVENKNLLGVITSKCKVLCTAKDDFNDLPSSEHLSMCDFFFKKAFNCDTLQIVDLDGVVDSIGAQKVYNKKEWLNWSKKDMRSTSLTSSPANDASLLPFEYHNSSSTITEQSTRKPSMEKRKRGLLEEVKPSPTTMMERTKKVKLSTPPSKKPKLSVDTVTVTKLEEQATKSESGMKNIVTIIDADDAPAPPNQIGMSNVEPTGREGFSFGVSEILEAGKVEEALKNRHDLSSSVPTTALERTMERVGNNADDIHVTCEGFPTESFLEPPENSESSTNKLKENGSNPQLIVEERRTSETGEPPNSKQSKVKKKPTKARGKKTTSKVVENKNSNSKNTSNLITSTTEGKFIDKRKLSKRNASERPQNKKKRVVDGKNPTLDKPQLDKSETSCENMVRGGEIDYLEDQQPSGSPLLKCSASKRPQKKKKNVVNEENKVLDKLLHSSEKSEDNCGNVIIAREDEIGCLEEQQPFGSPLAPTMATTNNGESLIKKHETLQADENKTSKVERSITVPLERCFESQREDWSDEFQMAVTTNRILLLHNIDPKLHSAELQEILSNFLGTKCQVRKIMPSSFDYTTTSALLQFSTQNTAQKSLGNLSKDCLILGERTLVATLYEDSGFANELHCFHGHICVPPKREEEEVINTNPIEMGFLPHVAQGNTIEFKYGLQWRLLQEQHELQWQLLNEFHEKELNLSIKEKQTNKRLRKSK